MPTTVHGILSEIKNRLLTVDNLSAGNVEIVDHERIEFPMTSRYAALIFWREIRPTGFPGGLEMKELFISIAMLHARETDERQDDILRLTMVIKELHDQALDALQARFLTGDGALHEPVEFLGSSPIKIGSTVIRINMEFRCMWNNFIRDRLAT